MGEAIEHVFSVRSSFAYLGVARLNALAAEFGVAVRHRPVDLLALVRLHGPVEEARPTDRAYAGARVFEADAARERYTRLEYRRWSEFLGVPINVDPTHHYGPRELPSGAVIAAERLGLDPGRVAHAILEALWRDDRDIADPAVIAALVDGIAPGRGAALCEAAMRPESQAELAANTAEAAARGVFGSPTYLWRGEPFFGQDRLDFLRRALEAG